MLSTKICSTLSTVLSPFVALFSGFSGFNFQGNSSITVFVLVSIILTSKSLINLELRSSLTPSAVGTPGKSVQQIVTLSGPAPTLKLFE